MMRERNAASKMVAADATKARAAANQQINQQKKIAQGLRQNTKATRQFGAAAHEASAPLTKAFRYIGLAYIAYNAITALKGAFIDYNTQLEQSKISMASSLFGFQQVTTFNEGLKRATRLVEDYRATAARGIGETKDYIEMHQKTQGDIYSAGGTTRDTSQISKGAVVASAAMGVEAWKMAQDIATMVRGTTTVKDYSAKQLIEMQMKQRGIDTGGDALQKFRDMFKNDAAGRLQFVKDALNSDAIKEAQKAYEGSMAGRIDQLKDNVRLALATAGEGLFDSLKDTLTYINNWIAKNPHKIKEWAKTLGDGLVSAFNVVKGVFAFIGEWSGPLMALAKAWMVTAVAMGAMRNLSALGAMMGGGMGMMGQAGLIAGGAYLGYAGLQAVADSGAGGTGVRGGSGNTRGERAVGWIMGNEQNEGSSDNQRIANNYLKLKREERNITEAANKGMQMVAGQTGILGSKFRAVILEMDALAQSTEMLGSMQRELYNQERREVIDNMLKSIAHIPKDINGKELLSKEQLIREAIDKRYAGQVDPGDSELTGALVGFVKAQSEMAAQANMLPRFFGSNQNLVEVELRVPQFLQDFFAKMDLTQAGQRGLNTAKTSGPAKPPPMNVTINRIQVESNDPERFVYGMREAFSDAVRNPSQAKPFIKKMGGGR